MATNANEIALTLDEEGLPTYAEIEPNAVKDNLTESKHKRSYFISFMIWASIVAIIIILILTALDPQNYYTIIFWLVVPGPILGVFCIVNCCECGTSSTNQYFKNKFDSSDELVNYIS